MLGVGEWAEGQRGPGRGWGLGGSLPLFSCRVAGSGPGFLNISAEKGDGAGGPVRAGALQPLLPTQTLG